MLVGLSETQAAGQLVSDVAAQDGRSASSSGQQNEGGQAPKLASCAFECGPKRPLTELFRSNPRAAPMCFPCYNAKRALTTAANKNPEMKAALARLQAEDPELWKAKVRGCRIVDPTPGSSGGQGVTNAGQRRAEIHQFLTSLSQTFGVQESGGVMWLKRSEFVAHHCRVENMDADKAGQLFDEKLADPAVVKMETPGDEARVPVMDIPRTTVYRKRELTKTVSGQLTIESQAQADDATRQMASVGVGAQSLSSPVFGELTAALRPGVAVGSSSGQPLPMGSLAAPPTAMVVPPTAFEGTVPKARRSLAAQISEPDEESGPPSKKRRAGGAALAGVTGQLLNLRQRGLDASARLWNEYGKVGKNVARQVEASARSSNTKLPQALEDLVNNYNYRATRAKTLGQQVKTWTLATAQRNLDELAALAEELEGQRTALTEALHELQDAKAAGRKQSAKARNEANRARTRHTAGYKGLVPECLLRYLYEEGALVIRDDRDADPEQDSQVETGPVNTSLENKWPGVVSSKETSFNASQPALFRPGFETSSVGDTIWGIVDGIGQKRIQAGEKDALRVMANSGGDQAQKRLEPKGQPADTLELLEWVPEEWRANKIMPEALRGMGAPTLLVSKVGECRYGPDSWPLVGLGQFVLCLKGEVTLFAWPAESVLQKGCDLSGQWQFLFSDLSFKPFQEWADNYAHFVDMSEGHSVWVPYGWYVASITRTTGSQNSVMLAQPYVAKGLASKCSEWPAVSEYLAMVIKDAQARGTKAWREHGPSALEWLQPLDAAAEAAVQALPALQDGRAEPAAEAEAAAGDEVKGEAAGAIDLN